MVALAYAATHPNSARALVLVGCGTFDEASRDRVRETREARVGNDLRRRLEHLAVEFPDPDRRLASLGTVMLPLDSYDLISDVLELETCDARGYQETWDDMLHLQAQGVYPTSFAAIKRPVLMLHGSADPHPGPMIRASLVPSLPQLEYREWERCGHYPWLERAVLRQWLSDQLRPDR
jgi:pimeloyl-ACP methyl ester carboxylesterase